MKIKLSNTCFLYRKRFLITLMRTFIFLFCTIVFSFTPENVVSQNSKIKIEKDKTLTVDEVFDLIMNQTDYNFFYQEGIFKDFPNIHVKKGVVRINKLLNRSLLQGDFEIIISNDYDILIKKKNLNAVNMQQKHEVSGIIMDQSGLPLAGANILEKGTTNGTQTDFDGNFSLTVADENAILVVSYLGFITTEVSVDSKSSIEITLQEDSAELDEVIVTAFGIKREKKSLGYSASEVKGESTAKESSFINNLSGKVAGVQINKGGSGIGASSRVVIRGNSSVSGNNQPLYIIDGVPLDNTSYSIPEEFKGFDSGDGLANVNPDDIETMTVLKGPNAAALYGSRAANGVILITTKSGTKGGGIGVSLGFNTSFESPMVKANKQAEFGQGVAGVSDSNQTSSWGAKLSQAPDDVLNDFIRTGTLVNTSIAIVSGGEKSQSRFSYSNSKNDGITPGNKLVRNSFSIKNTSDIGEKLKVTGKLNYVNQTIDNRTQGGENRHAYSNALKTPVGIKTVDLENFFLLDDNGNEFQNRINRDVTNPYWKLNRSFRDESRDRFIGLVSLNYQFNDKLSLLLRSGLDTYYDNAEGSEFAGADEGAPGSFTTQSVYNREFNNDFLLSYTDKLSENLDLVVSAGGNIRINNFDQNNFDAPNLEITNLFTLSNSSSLTSVRTVSSKEVQSLYGTAQLGYKGYLYLDVTARNDWSSTLPQANNSFFYPSVSVSGVISEMLNNKPDFLTYAKVRGSYAQVGNDIPAFLNIQTFTTNTALGGVGLLNNETLSEANLKPEEIESIEFGAEVKLFSNRLGLDFSYYKSNSRNQYIIVPQRASSGFFQKAVNAGNIENSGVEFLLTGRPIITDKFSWDVAFNISKNKNKVIELSDESDIQFLTENRVAQIVVQKGGSLGDVFVRGYERNANGDRLVNDDGLPIRTTGYDVLAGNVSPDWLGGISNSFKFGNFDFNFLIDFRVGGVIVSHTQAVLSGLGATDQTIANRDGFVFDGVKADGTVNTTSITAEQFWTRVGGRGEPWGEEFTYAADNIRLRQFGIGYSLPKKFLEKIKLQNVKLSLYGRNLFFISKKAPFDPEIGLSSDLKGQGIDFFSQPTLRSIGFDINVQF